MKFLNQLLRILKGYIRRLLSRGANLNEEDSISRFIFNKSYYRTTFEPHEQVKPAAFLPYLNNISLFNITFYERLETSVFITTELENEEIWKIGEEVAELRRPSLKARADLLVSDVNQTDLLIDFNNDPPKHADIVGWPKAKEKQLMQAVILASNSSLVVKPK